MLNPQKDFLLEASALGLKPGVWPEHLEIRCLKGEIKVFSRTMLHYESAGATFVGYRYETKEGDHLLVIGGADGAKR